MEYMPNLKQYREEKGLSQKELGDMVGVSEASISNYERGIREPSFDTLCALADIFDVSLDMLIRGKEKDRPKGRSLDEAVRLFKGLPDPERDMLLALGAFLQYRKSNPEYPGQEKVETP